MLPRQGWHPDELPDSVRAVGGRGSAQPRAIILMNAHDAAASSPAISTSGSHAPDALLRAIVVTGARPKAVEKTEGARREAAPEGRANDVQQLVSVQQLVARMVQVADADGDGQIDFEEYQAIVRRSLDAESEFTYVEFKTVGR